jgi:hypothetical protein
MARGNIYSFASMLGVACPILNRAMARFLRDNVVVRDGDAIRVVNFKGLLAIMHRNRRPVSGTPSEKPASFAAARRLRLPRARLGLPEQRKFPPFGRRSPTAHSDVRRPFNFDLPIAIFLPEVEVESRLWKKETWRPPPLEFRRFEYPGPGVGGVGKFVENNDQAVVV